MKTTLALLTLLFKGALFGNAAEIKQALFVDAPPSWEVTYKGEKGLQFYTVTKKGSQTALLMFSRWPVPGNKEQIHNLVDSLAKRFVARAKGNKEFKLEKSEYTVEQLQGDSHSGEFVVFSVEGGSVQSLFMFSDSDGIWNGQFTGSKEGWREALSILKKLKKAP